MTKFAEDEREIQRLWSARSGMAAAAALAHPDKHRVFAGDKQIPHRTHGSALTPDETELWISDQVGQKLFIFDEPTTGLHFDDINKLLTAFRALMEAGGSLIVIEHNLDVIKTADYVIDLGPDGGEALDSSVRTEWCNRSSGRASRQ